MPARLRRPETRRDREAVPDVALAIAEKLIVGGQNQSVIADRRSPLGQFAREASILVDEDLHPARRGAGAANCSSLQTEPWLRQKAVPAAAAARAAQRSPSGQNSPAIRSAR